MMIPNKRRRRFEVTEVDEHDELVCSSSPDRPKTKLKMVVGSSYFPKNNKLNPKGEDAHFICEHKNTIGIADGVGGWARHAVDSGIYARELMSNCLVALDKEQIGAVNPKSVLQEAYSNTKAQGSSTACVLTLREDHILQAANVDDSGFMIFRDNKLLFRSPTMQHGFNHPYQLGNHVRSDRPECADVIEIGFLEPGDIIVAGTDGVFDNIHPFEIVEVFEQTDGSVWPEQHACMIASIALENSLDEDYLSPFQIAAEAAGQDYDGGKYDDITVVVAMIESLKT
ncbi:putative protein phosphatase 2c [Tripterygium wilfordii]|uniref:Protein phosphatase n=1 Tax=Tripterygium wilfordii TaxID=458696 RepID=A0A7J7C201_TRIWF|nr:probable protein phosphatase 2C 55 [Tripterygium wilfordii]KAF5728189.1 putative protein phosphatase 2c [Tripterygium wilfordii]